MLTGFSPHVLRNYPTASCIGATNAVIAMVPDRGRIGIGRRSLPIADVFTEVQRKTSVSTSDIFTIPANALSMLTGTGRTFIHEWTDLDGAGTNRTLFEYTGVRLHYVAGTLRLTVGATNVDLSTSVDNDSTHRVAFSIGGNELIVSLDGATATTQTGVSTPATPTGGLLVVVSPVPIRH